MPPPAMHDRLDQYVAHEVDALKTSTDGLMNSNSGTDRRRGSFPHPAGGYVCHEQRTSSNRVKITAHLRAELDRKKLAMADVELAEQLKRENRRTGAGKGIEQVFECSRQMRICSWSHSGIEVYMPVIQRLTYSTAWSSCTRPVARSNDCDPSLWMTWSANGRGSRRHLATGRDPSAL